MLFRSIVETQEETLKKKRNQCHSTHLHYLWCHHYRFVLQRGPSNRCFKTRSYHTWNFADAIALGWRGRVRYCVGKGRGHKVCWHLYTSLRPTACLGARSFDWFSFTQQASHWSKTVRQGKSLMSSRGPTIWHNSRRHLKTILSSSLARLHHKKWKQTFSAAFPRCKL